MRVVILLLMVILMLLIYFIPTYVAFSKRHVNKVPILIINLFLGWTFIGWVIALVWATIKSGNTSG